jgi:hypothetical protein
MLGILHFYFGGTVLKIVPGIRDQRVFDELKGKTPLSLYAPKLERPLIFHQPGIRFVSVEKQLNLS